MSDTLKAVLDRTMTDEAFLQALRADPDAALADYDLDDEEREALVDGDERELRDLLCSPGSNGYTLHGNYAATS